MWYLTLTECFGSSREVEREVSVPRAVAAAKQAGVCRDLLPSSMILCWAKGVSFPHPFRWEPAKESCTPTLWLVLVWVICFPDLPPFTQRELEVSAQCSFPELLGRVFSSFTVSLMVSLLSFSCQSQLWAESLPAPKG